MNSCCRRGVHSVQSAVGVGALTALQRVSSAHAADCARASAEVVSVQDSLSLCFAGDCAFTLFTCILLMYIFYCPFSTCRFQTGHSHMALLLQKQEDTNKDPTAPTITAVGSCSSSSEGGSTPVRPGSRSSTASPAGSKPSRVAALIRSISGKALRRSTSRKDVAEPAHSMIAVHAGGLTAAGALANAEAAVDPAATDLELGTLPQAAPLPPPARAPHEADSLPKILPCTAQAASAPSAPAAAAIPHSASAPGPLTRPVTPGIVTPGVAAAALGRLSPAALARPSAASVWREAGWNAAGGVPVGVITLEDVLEELMQVCSKQKLQRHIRFDGRHASHVLCISTRASAVQAGVK